jgi:hypothetical protein
MKARASNWVILNIETGNRSIAYSKRELFTILKSSPPNSLYRELAVSLCDAINSGQLDSAARLGKKTKGYLFFVMRMVIIKNRRLVTRRRLITRESV